MAGRKYRLSLNNEKYCPVCGKLFYPLDINDWVYRHHSKLFCSWHCLRQYQKENNIGESHYGKSEKRGELSNGKRKVC